MMRSTLVFVLVVVSIGGVCCGTPPIAPSGGVVGTYRAVHWIEPGPADGPEDRLAQGRRLVLRLSADSTASGTMTDSAGVMEVFTSGRWSARGDTVSFESTYWLLDVLRFVRRGDSLTSVRFLARGPMQLDLVRQ